MAQQTLASVARAAGRLLAMRSDFRGAVHKKPRWRNMTIAANGNGTQHKLDRRSQKAIEVRRTQADINTEGVPGLRLSDYKDLFTNRQSSKVYPYRWDWHLRMGIYASLPALCFLALLTIADYFMFKDPDIQEFLLDYRIVEKEMREIPEKVEGLERNVEQRMSELELQVRVLKEALRRIVERERGIDVEERLSEARAISRAMVKSTRDN